MVEYKERLVLQISREESVHTLLSKSVKDKYIGRRASIEFRNIETSLN